MAAADTTRARCARLLLAALTATAAVAASAQPEPVVGVVVGDDGRPLAEVEVVLRAPGNPDPIERHTSDREGGFSLTASEVRPGRELHLHRAGFADAVVPITPQHLVVSKIELTMARSISVDPGSAPSPSATGDRSAPRYAPMPEERKRAIEIYNEGVKQYQEATKNKKEEERRGAEQKLRQSAALDPSFAEPHRLLARLAMKQQNWAEASRYAEDLIRINPEDVEAIRVLYLSLVIMQHHQRIGEAAKRLASADPESVTHIDEHARTFFANNQFVMARALYEALAEISDDRANAYLNLGICCAALGDTEGTRAAWATFLELAPADHPDIESVRKDLEALPASP